MLALFIPDPCVPKLNRNRHGISSAIWALESDQSKVKAQKSLIFLEWFTIEPANCLNFISLA